MTLQLLAMTSLAQTKPLSDKHFWHTLETAAPPDKIWSIWTDVPRWKNWDTGLQDASMEKTFKLDAQGEIVSLEGRKSKFTIVDYTEGKQYTLKIKLPLGSLYLKRYLDTQGNMTVFTHEVWFKGLTKGIFAKALGKKFRDLLPGVVENVKNIAEKG